MLIPSAGRPSRVRNVLLISPTDFTGNTALHVHAIASELARKGFSPAIAVPANVATVDDVGRPPFPVLSFGEATKSLVFDDRRGPDLLHAFTPRREVRRITLALATRYQCPYVVHLEDNEDAIGRAGGYEGEAFLNGALGVSAVIARLLEFAPPDVPSVVVWPGFDEAVLAPRRGRGAVRAELGLEGTLTLVYNGNVHDANFEEVRNLYLTVEQLRRRGHAVVLVRTGWNFVPRSHLPRLGDGLVELGWVSRRRVPDLLAAADILVQPGRPGAFNDYRFPSKLPEFLASGRPVVLPRTNIGLRLRDGAEALMLDSGTPDEIAERVARLAQDPLLRADIGHRGRRFALEALRWSNSVDRVVALYHEIQSAPSWRVS